jgi:serine acetyltransferase
MFENLKGDLRASTQQHRPKLESGFGKEDFKSLFQLAMMPVIAHRFGHWAREVRIPVIRQLLILSAGILRHFSGFLTGVYIMPEAEIGPGLVVHSLYGVLVGATTIGKNFTVQSGVLVAAGVRSIGDNVYLGSGAKILADTTIGNNVVIVANSVVLTDVPDNTTIMGVPARTKFRGGHPMKFPKTLR